MSHGAMPIGMAQEVGMVGHRTLAGCFLIPAVLLIGLFGPGHPAHAEDGCPDGMMPYQEQFTDPANGTLQLRTSCMPGSRYPQPDYQEPAPDDAPPSPPPDQYGAYATDPEYRQLFWSTFYESHEAAEAGAIEACGKATGKNCQSLGWFGNQCGAIAVTQNGQTTAGYDTSWRGAARQALEACEKAGADSYVICRLWVPPICSGPAYSAADNESAKTATVDEIEQLSAELDDRDYWGALASDGDQIQTSYGHPSRRAAETVALSKCQGCKIAGTFESSCAGMAWPSDKRPVYEIAMNVDPAVARAKATKQCVDKYGACDGAVRCSGRRYPNPIPGDQGGGK